MRTIVDPSAIAMSRSSDIPIESVSSANPRLRSASNKFAHAPKRRSLPDRVGLRFRDGHQAPQLQARQRRDGLRQRRHVRRCDAGSCWLRR